MTHEEVYRELAKERDAVTRWWDYQLSAQRRRALKCTRWPMHIWRDYTSPNRTRYQFYSRIFDKRMKMILTGVVVIRYTRDGMTVYTSWLGRQRLISPTVLTPHMWKRYAERAGINKSGLELVKHYFLHNPHGSDTSNQRVVGRSVRRNGEEHLSCCVTDGVLLCQLQGNLFIVRTFITYDMAKGLQQTEFGDQRKKILTDREMYDNARWRHRLVPETY